MAKDLSNINDFFTSVYIRENFKNNSNLNLVLQASSFNISIASNGITLQMLLGYCFM